MTEDSTDVPMTGLDPVRYGKAAKRVLLRFLPEEHSEFEQMSQQIAYAMWEEASTETVKARFREQLIFAALKDAYNEGHEDGTAGKANSWESSFMRNNIDSDDWM